MIDLLFSMRRAEFLYFPAADPGFPRWGGGRQHTILPIFSKSCMKLKEFGHPGGDPPLLSNLNPPDFVFTEADPETLYRMVWREQSLFGHFDSLIFYECLQEKVCPTLDPLQVKTFRLRH